MYMKILDYSIHDTEQSTVYMYINARSFYTKYSAKYSVYVYLLDHCIHNTMQSTLYVHIKMLVHSIHNTVPSTVYVYNMINHFIPNES